MEKPEVTFTSENGNVFNLTAIARKALKAAGKHEDAREILRAVTKAEPYAEALEILGRYVEFD
jgi:hypothetical protein